MRDEELDRLLRGLPRAQPPAELDQRVEDALLQQAGARVERSEALDAALRQVGELRSAPPEEVDRATERALLDRAARRRRRRPWSPLGLATVAAAAAAGLVVGTLMPEGPQRKGTDHTSLSGTLELRSGDEALAVPVGVGFRPELALGGAIEARWVALPAEASMLAWWVPLGGEPVALGTEGTRLGAPHRLPEPSLRFQAPGPGTLVLAGLPAHAPAQGLMQAIGAGRRPTAPVGGATFVAIDLRMPP